MKQNSFDPTKKVDLEVIIGTRNEAHDLISTIHSAIFALERTPLSWRILVVDDGSEDYSTKYLLETRDGRSSVRGLVAHGFVQVYNYPWLANVGCRDWAVRQVCTADYVAFIDAHVQIDPDAFTKMYETLVKFKPSMVHGAMDYWGSNDQRVGKQYSIKFGEAKGIYGTWTNISAFDNETPFYIGALGHCFFMMPRSEYLRIGGYNTYFREYGGGELSLCLASWVVGNGCMCDPRAHVYHSMFGRGYNYNSLNLDHNYFLCTYLIGGEKYSLASLAAFYQQKPYLKPLLKQFYKEALTEGSSQRGYILSNQHTSFEDVIGVGKDNDCDGKEYKMQAHVMRPWDIKNQEIYGRHLSFVRMFETVEKDGKIFIGNLEITDPEAFAIASNALHGHHT